MKRFMSRWRPDCLQYRKGSATLEFITILPLVFFMCLFVWQFIVAGMAVVDTQTLVRERARILAASGDVEEEEKRGPSFFSPSSNYQLSSYKAEIKDGQAIVKAKTEIEVVFLQSLQPFVYQYEAKAPVIK